MSQRVAFDTARGPNTRSEHEVCMSKLRNDRPPDEEVDHERGELRKPEDRSDQPGQQAPRGERDPDGDDPDLRAGG